ncbi:MAG: hypothetical protein ABIQ40_04835 [Bacteroidia bacterium]
MVQKTLGIELNAAFYDLAKLKEKFRAAPQNGQRIKPSFRWNKKSDGNGREWSINP